MTVRTPDLGTSDAQPDDPHRPRVHVTAPSGWLNDPNGFVHWNGRYHLFFQHNPGRPLWGPPQWAHVVSDDLVRWTGMPPALTPEMAPPDPDGCWTGSAATIDGRLVVHYTGVREGVQRTCRAEPLDDGLLRWAKDPRNPILSAPDDEPITHGAYRDPYVWAHGDGYRMVVGSSLDDRGAALLYASDDGRHWRYLHPLIDESHSAVRDDGSRTWECPLVLCGDRIGGDRLGADPDLLLVGVWNHAEIAHVNVLVGRFTNDRFEPASVHRLDHGNACFYAPQAIPRDGRWTVVTWLMEQRPDQALLAAGWAGAVSLARDVWWEAGELRQTFAPELVSLRNEARTIERLLGERRDSVLDTDLFTDLGIDATTFEARLTIVRHQADVFELDVCASPDGEERTRLRIDWATRELRIDKSATSRRDGPSVAPQWAAYPAMSDELDLHLHVDGSIVELIVDERVAISTRIYPSRLDATRVRTRGSSRSQDARGPEIRGTAWTLRPVAPATLPGAEESRH